MTCPLGGGVVQRHNKIRDVVARWCRSAKTEQTVPKWNTPEEKAVLDVAYTTNRGNQMFVDVSVVAGERTNTVTMLARREQAKHKRYPGAGMIPFVIDVRGRWAKEAQAWMRTAVQDFYPDNTTEMVQSIRYEVSIALMVSVAEQCARSMKEQMTWLCS